jgi:hypothetical protein
MESRGGWQKFQRAVVEWETVGKWYVKLRESEGDIRVKLKVVVFKTGVWPVGCGRVGVWLMLRVLMGGD